MGRAPCCDKANVKKGPWSPEEDAKLKSYIEQYGTGGNWIALPHKIGLKRCGKSCRLRWLNYLRPNIKHGGFSEEEDNIICSLYITIGSRWSIIAAQLPGRTDNDIKNYWNTRLKKKLLGSKQQRKDQSPNRRGTLKQEAAKRSEEHIDGGVHQPNAAYWAEPIVPAMYPINQAEHRVNDEHSSIRRLLMKLGGRFSTESTVHSPFAFNSHQQQQVFDAASGSLLMNTSVPSKSSIGEALPAPNVFNTSELDDLFSSSVKLEGLDCFYGIGSMIDDSNRTTISSDNNNNAANWSEVSPLMNYQSMISSYPQMQSCMFDEPVHLGSQ